MKKIEKIIAEPLLSLPESLFPFTSTTKEILQKIAENHSEKNSMTYVTSQLDSLGDKELRDKIIEETKTTIGMFGALMEKTLGSLVGIPEQVNLSTLEDIQKEIKILTKNITKKLGAYLESENSFDHKQKVHNIKIE